MTAAPFLSIRTMHELVDRNEDDFLLAAVPLKESTYIDDILMGADNIDTLLEIKRQITELLKCAEISLDKWLDNLKYTQSDAGFWKELSEDFDAPPKILGISWSAMADYFFIVQRIEKIDVLSKRHILSVVAEIFDPMGFLSPLIIRFKQFMQALWHLKLEWDESIPPLMYSD